MEERRESNLEREFNLVEQVVIAEIESILDDYLSHPAQAAVATPDLRQELVNYVLTRLTEAQENSNVEQDLLLNYNGIDWGVERQSYLEALTHQGIHTLLPTLSTTNSQFRWLERFNQMWRQLSSVSKVNR